jgi:hypothetical protein
VKVTQAGIAYEEREQDMKLLAISLLALSLSGIGASAQTDTDTVKINLGAADKVGCRSKLDDPIPNASPHSRGKR